METITRSVWEALNPAEQAAAARNAIIVDPKPEPSPDRVRLLHGSGADRRVYTRAEFEALSPEMRGHIGRFLRVTHVDE